MDCPISFSTPFCILLFWINSRLVASPLLLTMAFAIVSGLWIGLLLSCMFYNVTLVVPDGLRANSMPISLDCIHLCTCTSNKSPSSGRTRVIWPRCFVYKLYIP
ncbi:hypothetical protein J3A83DRAFT_3468983 [Scleroderma citrinum]